MRRMRCAEVAERKIKGIFMGTAIVLGILFVCCFIGVRSSVKRIAHGCCGGDVVKKKKPADTDISHYPYVYHVKVEGMTCSQCKICVENILNEMDGVYATVHLRKKTAELHSKSELDREQVRQAVDGAGYRTEEWKISS